MAAVAALTSCTVNGPDPDSEPPATSAPTTKSSSLDLPQRPRDLAIAGKQDAEICAWLKSEQKQSLQIGGSGRPVQRNGNNYNGCAFLGEAGNAQFGFALRVVPEGIQSFMSEVNSSPESEKAFEINGFGAVQGQIAGGESLGCDVFVDAAEGQTLWINMMLQTPGGMDNDQMCERAKQAAEAAVTTLQGS
ncbi:DUF3558 domain-containing protein [Saccharopolyspora shandongensis]|uniref:DUF3558 domain-containing protein n=1 Tax=Saccharopolyspora shandongensis TaxID=418495 RepID=UPI0015A53ADB|nr:DUF3558 domain-containing protein [Saccharopolyspora shandongensis]